MEQFEITEEERQLILNRRKFSAVRMGPPESKPAQPAEKPVDPILGQNRPPGWDSHADLGKCHKGRLTQDHPFFFFETDIFKKISNMEHKEEHKKMTSILGMPVQSPTKDRVYHLLSHMDILWYEKRLPLHYKKRQEELKAQYGIGADNVPESQKKQGIVYRSPKIDLPEFNAELYDIDENEEFTGEVLDYSKYLKAG
jgi:hypothetical protein